MNGQPQDQTYQSFIQTPAASTNLDPLTQPSVAPIAPATTAVAPAAPADITAPPAPAVTPDPTPTTPPETTPTPPAAPTPPAQDTFAPPPLSVSSAPTQPPAESPATPAAIAPAPTPATDEPPTAGDSPVPAPVKNALLDHYPTGSEIIEKDILELLGSSDMSEEEKNNLYQKMNDTVANRVTARIVDALSDEEVDEWVKLLDTNDQKSANELLGTKGIDPAQLIAKEALIYKTQLVDVIYGSGNQEK